MQYRLLASVAGAIYAWVSHPEDRHEPEGQVSEQLMDSLRRAFREHRPDVDVSEDAALGRAIEARAISLRDRAQPEGWHWRTVDGQRGVRSDAA